MFVVNYLVVVVIREKVFVDCVMIVKVEQMVKLRIVNVVVFGL